MVTHDQAVKYVFRFVAPFRVVGQFRPFSVEGHTGHAANKQRSRDTGAFHDIVIGFQCSRISMSGGLLDHQEEPRLSETLQDSQRSEVLNEKKGGGKHPSGCHRMRTDHRYGLEQCSRRKLWHFDRQTLPQPSERLPDTQEVVGEREANLPPACGKARANHRVCFDKCPRRSCRPCRSCREPCLHLPLA